jgi:hypothetical protein
LHERHSLELIYPGHSAIFESCIGEKKFQPMG